MGIQCFVILMLVPQFNYAVDYLFLKRCTHSLFIHCWSVGMNEVTGMEHIVVSQTDSVKTLEPRCRFRVNGITEVGSRWGIYRPGCGSDHMFVNNSIRGRL